MEVSTKPFLKWAGGKFQLKNPIAALLPPGNRLIEPFVGAGAIFLNTNYPAYTLNDANSDLITLYKTLQKEGKNFIRYCKSFFTAENNTPERYYELRNTFNSTTNSRLKSALFLYLNRHGYNGLCRYNRQGSYNVPFGRYLKPYFPEAEMHFFHEKSQRATFTCTDFTVTMQRARKNNVIYCDPPYAPLNETAYFTQYQKNGFSLEEQIKLAQLANILREKNIPVVISNHDTPFTREHYEKASEIIPLQVRRNISCHGNSREMVKELLALFS